MPGRPSGPIVRTFPAPYSGLVRSIPPNEVPPTGSSDCRNVFFSRGALRARPGFLKLSQVGGLPSDPSFSEIPLGAGYMITSTGNLDIYVAAETNLWRLRNVTGSWTDVSGSLTLTSVAASDHSRFASLYNKADGTNSIVCATSRDGLVQSLDGANFTAVTGEPTFVSDVATVASRIMGIEYPHKVVWSDIHASGTWPSLNVYRATDTPGAVVAVRNLGVLGAVIYKQDSIIVAYSQPGTPATAFRFETRYMRPGPACASAVVDVDGTHFYMTARGRIAAFDGSHFEWVGDGSWPYFFTGDNAFDYFKATQTTGFYDPSRHVVVFIYPRVVENGAGPTGLAIVTLPRPEWGVHSYGVWPGILAWPVNFALSMYLTTGGVGIVGRKDSPYMVNIWAGEQDVVVDQGTNYTCLFDTGLQSTPEVHKVDIEAFLSRKADPNGYGTVSLAPLTSYNLGHASGTAGTVGTAQTVDLENTSLVRDVKGYNASGRFVGLELAWTSDAALVEYKGAIITSYPVD